VTSLQQPRRAPAPQTTAQESSSDLGFGSVVARESRRRFLNRDGSFNVRREGLGFWQSISAYHYFLTVTWGRFVTYLAVAYIFANAIFATLYTLCGPGALSGSEHMLLGYRFQQAFFFSVHTLGTIGYGNVAPVTLAANILVTLEALVGLVALAMIAGIIFARFSRPVAKIMFSESAVIGPYGDGKALMFRIVNQKKTQIVDLHTNVLLIRRKECGAQTDREFLSLKLEREHVAFFPLTWTVVHAIDSNSPLFGISAEDFANADSEVMVLLNGFDETFSQTVHTRSSYKADEVVWDARFRSLFLPTDDDGVISVDIRKLHEIDHA
jgi:inward rectifier potassium channel